MLNYPQVALDFMNRDHQEFVSLREKLLGLLSETPSDQGKIAAMLDELLEHTRHHFAEEEGRMLAAQFPPYPMHKGEHDRVLADMAAHVEAWEQNHDDAVLKNWLEQEVGNWFVNHVNTMDFITATFIASRR